MSNEVIPLHSVAKMARDIVDNLGYDLIEEDYYTDWVVGRQYKYDQLTITSKRTDGIITISIGNNEVLCYNFFNPSNTSIDAEVSQLIKIIYDQIPNVLEKRRKAAAEFKRKTNELNDLAGCFKYYIECFKNNNEVLKIINSKLFDYEIVINRETRYNYRTNINQYYDEKEPYYVYVVSFQNQVVANFSDNPYNLFPDLSSYVNKYQSGEWTNHLKSVVVETKNIEQNLNKKAVHNTANEMIKKLKKDNL